jgi:hypothetical protein
MTKLIHLDWYENFDFDFNKSLLYWLSKIKSFIFQIATLHKNHNETDIVFDIVPVKQTKNYRKRSLDSVLKNDHAIFKRALSDDLNQIRDDVSSFENPDFQETRGFTLI